jgi:uncharacterized protein (TIGR02302 family)
MSERGPLPDSENFPPPDLQRRLSRRLVLARLALAWEMLWPALWPASLALGIFLTLALFGVPDMLPGWFQALLLAALAAIFALNLVVALRRLTFPSHEAARRRIETASHMTHRPLTTLEDRLTGESGGEAATLWQAHRARMSAAIRRLRVGRPRSFLARRDPYYLRAALVLALAAGVFAAGGDWRARIFRAFHPDFALFGPAAPAGLDVWISPPQYTGLPPQFLTGHAGPAPIAVPIGSNVLAQVHGGGALPELRVDRLAQPMSRVDDGDFKGQLTLTAGALLEVTQGYRSLGAWPIRIVPDRPPSVAFAKPPETGARGELRIAYDASDDYGVESVKLLVVRPGGDAGETLSIDLPLPDQHRKNAQGTSFVDLTANPGAGGAARLQLVAADALGQTGSSDTIETTLPERVFLNPLARAIGEQRKELLADPSSRQNVAATVGGLALNPKYYNDDIVVFLALRTASDRLMLDRESDAVPVVAQLLWDTAVRVEDGGSLSSRNTLSQSMQALQQALAQNAPEAQIEQMLGDLQQQIGRYLQSLSAQGQSPGRNPASPASGAASGQSLTSQDFQALLDRARDLSAAGSRSQARQLLAKLQDLLENLRVAGPADMHGPQGHALDAMQDLIRRQQQLLDRSFRASRQPGGNKAANPNEAAAQEALRRALGQAAQGLADHGGGKAGGIPLSMNLAMNRADHAMRDAALALNQGRPDAAVNAQTDALDALQQAARSLAQSLANVGEPGAPGNSLPGAQRDPLGRLEAGEGSTGEGGDLRLGKSANDAAIEKAREILGELRRRAGEQQRPEIERAYIDRLLKEF